jgi:alpha,alpha-trehalase
MSGGGLREAYYWDTYFTMMGLVKSGKVEHAKNMLNNISYLIDKYGHVPNGTRTYYASRSQPPVFALMVRLMAEADTSVKLATYLPQLKKEYEYWMDGRDSISATNPIIKRVVRMGGGEILNRYWDPTPTPRPEAYWEDVQGAKNTYHEKPIHYQHVRAACESGWNFSSRWLGGDQTIGSINTAEFVPVDLNSLLYELERTIGQAYRQAGDDHEMEHFFSLADDRKRAVLNYCWSPEDGFFFDYSFVDEYRSGFATLAGLFPLFTGMATQDQAFSISEQIEEEFLKDGGLTCTNLETGQQWDAPNGWAPLHWVAYRGLDRYGLDALADDIAQRWIATVEAVFAEKGVLLNKYNVVNIKEMPVGGDAQEGYGWTNGVYLMLKREY